MSLKRVHFHFQFTSTFRQETRKGHNYLVVPGIILQEQVLNYYLVPAEEINTFPEAWNGVPVTIRHPDTINGSANWVDQDVIGRIFNARYDEATTQLHAEFWLDQAELQANASGDGRLIETRVKAGDVIEVSTGYWANEEFTEGDFQGRHYYAIHHDLRPDHVAVLVDQIGACSVEDGCGMPRVNCAQCESDQVLITNLKKPYVAKKGIQIMAFFKKKQAKQAKKPTSSKVKITDPAMLTLLTALNVTAELVPGTQDEYMVTNEAQVEEPVEEPGDEDEPQRDPFALELEAALEGIGGAEGFTNLLTDLQDMVSAHKAENQSAETKKNALIKKLTKNGKFPLSADTLQKLSLEEVQALVATNEGTLGGDFGALGAADLVALNAGEEDEDAEEDDNPDELKKNAAASVRKSRGIGLAGTLGEPINISINSRTHSRGGVK